MIDELKGLTEDEKSRIFNLQSRLGWLPQNSTAHGWSVCFLEAIANHIDQMNADANMMKSDLAKIKEGPKEILDRLSAIEHSNNPFTMSFSEADMNPGGQYAAP